jgi:copper chaperone CopZ
MLKKTILINGMTCGHCEGAVLKALSGITGITDVQVILKEKKAIVSMVNEIEETLFLNAVENAGYSVEQIKN